jgi:hypothetical protein
VQKLTLNSLPFIPRCQTGSQGRLNVEPPRRHTGAAVGKKPKQKRHTPTADPAQPQIASARPCVDRQSLGTHAIVAGMNRPPIPLRADYSAVRRPTSAPFIRAACAYLTGCVRGWDESRARWPDDDGQLVLRAATSPASTTVAAWAGSLASTSLVNFIGELGPASAGAQLLQRGLQLQFEGHNALVVPALLPSASSIGFVAEGNAIPVKQFSIAAVTLTPKKFAVITSFSNEILAYSRRMSKV